MSGWNIQPAEVGAVLTSVAGYIGEEGGSDGLVGAMTSAENLITAINEEANSTPVSVALGEFAEHNFGLMGDMAGLTVSAVTGASEATTHYFNGNLDMAAEAQENAGVIPEPEPPSTHGRNIPV
ncbi:DUF6507 family protein [Nocardiopsis dassonvillei]|uniref:DUF6507 family protein n=1 Tax=Nocardiopsis dassonvillei TaxID=2014 RepID=UPI00157C6BD2|nr:DUF6507 family protein [Nocardiopsis dassonvillei]